MTLLLDAWLFCCAPGIGTVFTVKVRNAAGSGKRYAQMCDNAGIIPAAVTLTAANLYGEIIKGTNALDNTEVPDTGRVLMVTPDTYLLTKQSKDIAMETDIGNDISPNPQHTGINTSSSGFK